LFAIEIKVIKDYTFNLKSFEEQQINYLNNIWENSRQSMVIIYSKKKQEYCVLLWGELLTLLNGKSSVKLFEKSSGEVCD
jgi:penicillin-binding protein-related factor A (putative recombinase)